MPNSFKSDEDPSREQGQSGGLDYQHGCLLKGFQIYVISACHLSCQLRDDRQDGIALKSSAKKDDRAQIDDIAQMAISTKLAPVISSNANSAAAIETALLM